MQNFPGKSLYAIKANDAPHVLAELHEAGIRDFDVASLPEIVKIASLADARAHLMHPIKSRDLIRRAYFEHGVRTFALDCEAELDKIVAETGHAKDLTLLVRMTCPNSFSEIPLEDKFGISWVEAPDLLRKTRQFADCFGLTFHVGSQAMSPAAYGQAMKVMSQHIVQAGVLADVIDVGGGFPSIYPGMEPPALADYMDEIREAFDQITVGMSCELWAEPGRALVAEAESLIVKVDARKDDTLYINDGAFGVLYDATHMKFVFPARRVETEAAMPGLQALAPFELWGPTCDSIDHMKGPFFLPPDTGEGDYIEIGNIGAYGRVMACRFNGFGHYQDALLTDEPMLSLYGLADALSGAAAGR
nr:MULTISPECIES: type III PLP-dependent enzyme [Rhodomicrobium]